MRAEGMYRVAQVAQVTGVTIRTLHHYDDIALLKPSKRSGAGHRLYSDDDLVRLQQILTLRHMGFSLEEIGDLLDSHSYDLRGSLMIQKAAIDSQIQRLQAVSDALATAIEAVDALKQPEITVISSIIRGLTVDDAAKTEWTRQYYTDSAWEKIQARRENYHTADIARGVQDWANVINDFRQVQHLPPGHPDVQKIAVQMNDLVMQFTGGDPEIEASLRHMYSDMRNIPAEYRLYNNDLRDFMGAALEIYRQNHIKGE